MLENFSDREPMNEKKDERPPIEVEEFQPKTGESGGGEGSGSFIRGCGIAVGVVALIFFFVVGVCFIKLSQW